MENQKVCPVDEKLPVSRLIPLGFQHVFAMYAGALAVPIILAGAMNLSAEDLSFLIAADLFTCGLATLVQTLGIGNYAGIKLPAVLGCSFVAVVPMVVIGTKAGNDITVIFGAVIASGIFIWVVAGLFAKLIKFFPPLVTGIVITTVGITLIPLALQNSAGGVGNEGYGSVQNLILASITLLVVLVMNRFFKGFLQSISILVALVVGTVIATFMGVADYSEVSNAGWFHIVTPFHFGWPTFKIDAIISICLVGIVTTIEAIGVFGGLGEICEKKITEKDIVKGIRAEGITKIMGGVMNSFPYTTFSQNVGLVTLSGVKSRYVCVSAGIILAVLGLIPKFAALGTAIPISVLGGATLVMFGTVAVSGMRILSKVDFSKQGNIITIAVSLGLGLGFKFVPDALGALPEAVDMYTKDGILVASLMAIVLNIVFNYKDLGKKEVEQVTESEGI